MSDCCLPDDFAYRSSLATDPTADLDEGQANPNCPDGYVWGGTSCVREAEPQECSEGWLWDGTKCVEATASTLVCALGFFNNSGVCTACVQQAPPSLVAHHLEIVVNFTVDAGANFNIFRSPDGVNWVRVKSLGVGTGAADFYSDTDMIMPGTVYYYYLSVYTNEECGYIDGQIASTLAI